MMNSWMAIVEISCATHGAPATLMVPMRRGMRPSMAIITMGSAHNICQDT